MAGTGFDSVALGPGVEISEDSQTATRPNDGGGSAECVARGTAVRNKGPRYFEVSIPAGDATVGVADAGASLDGQLGAGGLIAAGLSTSDAMFHYQWSQTDSGSTDTGAGALGSATYGVSIDFENGTISITKDGAGVYNGPVPESARDNLRPAVSLAVGAQADLQTTEPFQHPPVKTFLAWDQPDYAIGSKIAGSVKVDGSAAARMVKAFSFERQTFNLNGYDITESKPLGQTVSDKETGDYRIILRDGYTGQVFVTAFDDYGMPFQAAAAVKAGDRIHPTTPNGYVYQCTGSGNLGDTEPDPWPVDDTKDHLIGSATFQVKPFFRPMIHGPIKPELLELSLSPSDLFLSGNAGVWFDPSDRSTLWQDIDATQPVTGDGQEVALMYDKSGNGAHAVQSDVAKRPVYRTDGARHWLEFSGSQRMDFNQQISGTMARTTAYATQPDYLGDVNDVQPPFDLQDYEDPGTGADYTPTHEEEGIYLRVDGNSFWTYDMSSLRPFLFLMEWTPDFGPSSEEVKLYEKGDIIPISGGGFSDLNTNNTGTSLIGHSPRQSDSWFSGRIYGILMINRILNEQEKAVINEEMAAKTQVSLN